MDIKNNLIPSAAILKGQVNRYTFLGLGVAISSILIASFLVSYQLTGALTLNGIIDAHKNNPAIWFLDLTPFVFGYWGQAFCQGLVSNAETILSHKTEEFLKISGNLEQKLKYESYHDSLTKLPNIYFLSEKITNAIHQLGEQGQLALVIIELNELKHISHHYGTFIANSVLMQFTDQLKSILVDPYVLQASSGIGHVARKGESDFALLLPKLKKEFNQDEFLSVLHQLLKSQISINGVNLKLNTTSGLAIYPVHGQEEGALLNHASIAIHHAKKNGLPYMTYHSEMEKDFTQNQILLRDLQVAIKNNKLDIFFQPIVDLSTGHIVGADTIVRFEHPQLGVLDAEEFMPLIEGTTLSQQLSETVLKEALKQLIFWHQGGHSIYVSVSISTHDAANRDTPPHIKKLLTAYNVDSQFLKLGVTERACLNNQSITKSILEQLSSMGIELFVEDFCSGYSSFIYALNLPISSIRIEKSNVAEMVDDEKKTTIIKAIIHLAENLNLKAIADGINDASTMKKLKKMGCAFGQGFYFSRPVNGAQFKELLDEDTKALESK